MQSTTKLVFPPKLLEILSAHMALVESQGSPKVPTFTSDKLSIYDFFERHKDEIQKKMTNSNTSTDLTACCIQFFLEMIEQACSAPSLISAKERKYYASFVNPRMKQREHEKGVSGKREREETIVLDSVQYRLSRVLPMEYFLRFCFSLPYVVDHYVSLAGGSLPSYADAPLWDCVNASLSVLSQLDVFSDTNTYLSV
ncbi:hypothetical protein AGDE_00955 [Angomonas deanei]|nr:hypothetical protein AGDE_00955 [Angomonas deanei]|eukprot:EPY42968.1 hypothetical protein AGDE_00955 [Angomonas deanei]